MGEEAMAEGNEDPSPMTRMGETRGYPTRTRWRHAVWEKMRNIA